MAQFFQTTNHVAAHRLFLDVPRFLDTRFRMDLDVAWSIDKFSPWYGVGNEAQYRKEYDTCDDRDAVAQNPDACPGNASFRGLRYYRYSRDTLPRIKLNFRGDVDGPWKALAGYRFSLNRITPFYGLSDLGQTGESQLQADALAGRIHGYEGDAEFTRREASLVVGGVYDTRDNEPAPVTGVFHEVSLTGASKLLGGEDAWWGVNATARFYTPLWPGSRRLVGALRVLFDAMGGDVPFFVLNNTGGLDGPEGVGGQFTLRGLLKNRLQGKGKLLVSPELRWTLSEGEHFDWRLVAGVDAGRVWAELDRLSEGGGLAAGASMGVRMAWNRTFVVRLDVGWGLTESYGDGAVYLTFDEMF
jgi:outer membrane protein assembly factor BamA